jgi:hypothetical protein
MSQSRSRGRRGPAKRSQGGKGGGGKRKQNRSGGQKRGQKRARKKPVVDPKRDFWEMSSGGTAAASTVARVRPAPDPTALVRSLGPPPLGKFADNAEHYYAPMYETAQRFAVAMAAANGVLATDDADDAEAGAAPADPRAKGD